MKRERVSMNLLGPIYSKCRIAVLPTLEDHHMRLILCAFLVILASNPFASNLYAQDPVLAGGGDPTNSSREPILRDYIPHTVSPPPPPRAASQPATPLRSAVSINELRIPSAAMKELRQFQRNFESGKVADSVKHLEKAIQIYPQLPAAHQNLGACYARLHQYDKAVAEFESAAALDEHLIQPKISLSAMFFLEARDSEAEAAVRRALEIDGTSPVARYLLARVLAAEGRDPQEAIKLLRESGTEYPAAHLVLANLLLKRGAKEEAVAELREYLKRPAVLDKDKVACIVEKLTGSAGRSSCSSK